MLDIAAQMTETIDHSATAGCQIGLLGDGISASRTPSMHLAAAQAMGLPYSYSLIDPRSRTLPEDVGEILSRLEAEGFNGINVTYPYKRAVIPYLDQISEAARKVGAVNTILFRDGKRLGHNTDHWGFAESMRRGLPDARMDRVLLLGAGGAGGAVAHALLDGGAGHLAVRDVNAGVANDLVDRLNDHYGSGRASVVTDVFDGTARANGVVNASPVGMRKMPGLPLPAKALRHDLWVADIVYFPLETELLATARALGCAVLPGSGMALYQAIRAFELFSGRKPEIGRMREAFDAFD